ncbi:transposase [Synechococcus sp. CBW1002]|uniref:transposase n=1 Tax=Synechococcus sp. CBW1002 TaxID=1353134 RepID=UPI0018CCAA43|nr:transposase [Synechococcus sp. CBW1002]QPN59101.1 transposase [Synechococcus sp. CBW1002]QPN61014.1 transposase [Synechococcus sp. CBW1002]
MPPSPIDWLPSDHLVFFLLELVEELDFALIMSPARQKDARGEKGYDPRMLTLLLLYAYCIGMASSRKIERACHEDAAFRVLTGNQQPDHSRISDFRRRHLGALEELFVQILRLCQKAGMVSLGQVALDGTKVKANASKHKTLLWTVKPPDAPAERHRGGSADQLSHDGREPALATPWNPSPPPASCCCGRPSTRSVGQRTVLISPSMSWLSV